MAKEKNHVDTTGNNSKFRIEGQVQREQAECQPGELALMAYVFDSSGASLGEAKVESNGNYSVGVKLMQATDVELMIAPPGDAQQIRSSSAYSEHFSAKQWTAEGGQFRLRHDVLLPLDLWRPWWPQRICISGHVRKISVHDGVSDICAVPFVKVEIFDVDRESCWWPWLRNWWDVLLDRPVIRLSELLKERPVLPHPFPGPDPAPDFNPGTLARQLGEIGGRVALNPQPEPPLPSAAQPAFQRVGEARLMDPSIAARLDNLTLTSRRAPWDIFRRCFYSKALVCETSTDCNGYFRCCFNWWPFHFRHGRLRFDARPDIIIKVTQIINGVTRVIYMDPYTSTRWNVTHAHIDLFLDDEDVVCGNSHCYEPPPGSPVFFTRIGDDEVYQINQTNGLYNDVADSNVAYGSSLYVYGQFGDALTRSDPGHGDPPPYFYYRLSYAKQGSPDVDFKYVDINLNDTRVNKGTLIGQAHKLGPYNVNATPSLYEVRNFNDYYWYNPDWIGTWNSLLAEEDTGTYILRLEVFDKNGGKLNTASGLVDYRNGAGVGNGMPPAPLPPMVDHCDLVITLDNKPPVVDLQIPAVTNECGVIPWTAVPPLDLSVSVVQENGRLHSWGLQYTKGINPAVHVLDSGVSHTGVPAVVNKTVDATNAPTGINMLDGVTSTCAFALKLWATAHVRDGRNFIFYREQIKAIAIEKCP